MNSALIRKITMGGVLTAIITVMTSMQIPLASGHGYLNLGDLAIVASVFVFPEYFYSAAAAGIGSCLCDIISGYGIYAPATLITKAVFALCCVFVTKKMPDRRFTIFMLIPLAIVVPTGYFIWEYFVLRLGIVITRYDALFNFIQSAVGIAGGYAAGICAERIIRKINSK